MGDPPARHARCLPRWRNHLVLLGAVLLQSCMPGALTQHPRNSTTEVRTEARIKDGVDAPEGRFPYMVSVRNEVDDHVCGGVLIDRWAVLTAAHCITVAHPTVYIGQYRASDGPNTPHIKAMKAELVFTHDDWDAESFTEGSGIMKQKALKHGYDVAIVQLPEPIDGVDVPTLASAGEHLEAGRHAWSLGFGEVGRNHMAEVLQAARLKIQSHDDCIFTDLSSTLVCAYSQNSDTCTGDSGGPLLTPDPSQDLKYGDARKDKLVGIVSSGANCFENWLSDRRGGTGLYTQVSSVRNWIHEKVAQIHKTSLEAKTSMGFSIPRGRIQYVVSIRSVRSPGHLCSGVLIHPNYVLTAAHCVDPDSQYGASSSPIVRLGATHVSASQKNVEEVLPEEIIIHEDWLADRRVGSPYNIALLKVRQSTVRHHPVLAQPDFRIDNGQGVVAFGWGQKRIALGDEIFGSLNFEEQTFLDASTCNRAKLWGGEMEMGQVCAINHEHTASCVVDSGSPILILYHGSHGANSQRFDHLVGINVDGAACGVPDKPDKYIDVRPHRAWIDAQIKRAQACPPCSHSAT